jgi:hypothetical protein
MTKLNRLTTNQFFREVHTEIIPLSSMRKFLPAKDAFYPGLKNYSHQETKLLHLKLLINVRKCSVWWIDDNNTTGWIQKPPFYPTVSLTNFGDSTPSSPKGHDITNKTLLSPCKILFSFLLKA